ncbi:DNA/RNA endonuclease YhcR with UshA esterase domain [Paenibacillus amylolyticus]|uniref:DNA/RNA endonuclease YhcR with UshA esterase domain n=1 Tax=Paenibacillus amylolyticus TaxID=1451 RepID=A0AAP5LNC1_PAEAM|nr:DNA/RNA endonuclease YhcR with UshA esterase domain [Paenibacillus amylolyticus]
MGKLRSLRGVWLKLLLALSMALPLQIGLWNGDASVHAEGPTDPAPFIQAKVVNENAGKKVLFDNSHGQTAGAADWVIDGGFSDFGNALANDGYDVKELRKTTPFTYEDLKEYSVFVIAEPQIPFKTSEQAAMKQYVEQGGSIFFIGDHYNADRNKNRWDGSEAINGYRRGAFEEPTKGMSTEERNSEAMQNVTSTDWLSENFGIRFRYNALGDIDANIIVPADQAFGITEGVSSVAMHAGSTLAITDPTLAKGIVYLPKTNAKWNNAVDQGVYNGGGIEEGPYVAVSKLGAGKAAFIGDSSPVEDASPKYLREETGTRKTTYDGFKEADDAVLLVNTVNWLATQENYTSLTEVAGLELDTATALLPFEEPAASTEPQAEPWAAPAAGYKWYDRSTFKAGSYGGPASSANASYSFVKQDTLPNAEDFQVRVVVENMPPNTTVSGYSAGIYLTGGTQVAMIQNDSGTWPTSYGYSSAFSVTSDSKGRAIKDLNVRIKPGTDGNASLRLRLNGSNLITNAVTVGNVPAVPLPEEEGPIPAAITVAEARTKAVGTTVTIEGVVTTQPGSFGGQAFYLQDETAGIYVFQHTSGFQVGDKVKVTAPTTIYNSEFELTDVVAIEKTGTASVPAPALVTAITDANQGQLVQLKDVTVQNIISATPAGSFEFDAVAADGTTTHVRVDTRTGVTETSFPYAAGDKIDITGVSAIFKDVYQLKPRSLNDFVAAEDQGGGEVPSTPAVGAPGKPVLSSDNGYTTGLFGGSYNVTMNLWWGDNGSEYKLYENGVLIDTQKLTEATPQAQSTKTAITDKANGTYTYVAELTNSKGTTRSDELTVQVTNAAPGKATLSQDNWDGDGNYSVTMNLWWGTNATEYRLYENDVLIDTQELKAATPASQRAVTDLSGRANGTYTYHAELINAAGVTSTETITVQVSKAALPLAS